jgi:hypothetical protein
VAPAAPPLALAAVPEVRFAPPPAPPQFWEPLTQAPRQPVDTTAGPEIEICSVEALQPDGLLLRGLEGGSDLLPFAEVAAILVAGIAASPRPFLVLDLVMAPVAGQPLRVERLLSTEFDPRQLTGRSDLRALDAFREVVRVIAGGSGARIVPDALLEPSTRIPTFETLEAYEEQVLSRCHLGQAVERPETS